MRERFKVRQDRHPARLSRRQGVKRRKAALAYTSLYLDQGERPEFAREQIDHTIQKAIQLGTGLPLSQVYLMVDLIGTPQQVASGICHNLAVDILRYADETYPGLKGRTVGITDDDDRRPMRDVLNPPQP